MLSLLLLGYVILKNDKLQQRFVSVVTESLSEKVNSIVSLKSIDWEFPNSFVLHDVYIEDQAHDTLLVIDRTKVTINIWELINAKVSFRTLQLTGMDARINKDEEKYNFQFFIDAFRKTEKDTMKIKWSMDVESIALNDCNLSFYNDSCNSRPGQFNPDFIEVSSLNGSLQVRHFTEDSLNLKLNDFSFKELSGLELSELSTTMVANTKNLKFYDFTAQMPNSLLVLNDATFLYSEPSSFKRFYTDVFMSVSISPSFIDLTDLSAFLPAFASLEKDVLLKGNITGTIKTLLLRNFSFKYGNKTTLQGDFYMDGLPDPDKLHVRANVNELSGAVEDIVEISEAFTKKQIQIPSVVDSLGIISYSGKINGKLTDLEANGLLACAAGSLTTNLILKATDLTYNDYSISGKIDTRQFNLNKIAGKKSELGKSTFKLNVDLKKSGKNHIALNASGFVDSLVYKKYCYENISINGKFNDEGFDGSLIMSDKNAEVSFKGNIDLNKEKPIFRFNANVKDVKPYNLNLTKKHPESSLSFDIETNFIGKNLDDIEGTFSIDNIVFVEEDKEIFINNISLSALSQDNQTKKISLFSDYINGHVTGNYHFTSLVGNFKNLASHYIPAILTDSVKTIGRQRNNFEYNFVIDNTEPIQEMIELPFTFMEEAVVSGFYNDSLNKFRVRVDAPSLKIGNINMGDFLLLTENPGDHIKLTLRGTHLPGNTRRNPYFVSLNSKIKENKIDLDMFFSNSMEETYSGAFSTAIMLKGYNPDDGLMVDIDINPTEIILNDVVWNIHPGKIAVTSNKKIAISNFYFNHENQYLKIDGVNTDMPEDSIQIRFSDLQLGYISEILNLKDFSFDGISDGDLYLFQLFKDPFFEGDVNIYDAVMNGYLLGDLLVNAAWKEEDKCIAFDSNLFTAYKGERFQSDIYGGVYIANDSLFIEGDLKNIDLKFLRQYLGTVVQNNTGFASGVIRAYGKFGHVGLEGAAVVKDMAFDVDYLKTSYVLSDTVFMTPNSFRLNQAQVFDIEGNYGIASGLVLHEGFKNFKFAVDVSCSNILGLNTKEQDNEMFYGKAYVGGNVNISGNQDIVNFNLNVRTSPNTKITIPIEGNTSVRDVGFITFVESTDNLTAAEKRRLRKEKLQRIQEEKKTNAEMNIVINLEATPDAQVQLVMDSKQGDVIKGSGSGNLRLLFNTRDSDFKMYGNYEIAKGEYLFTIQSIIPRKFDITEGSLVRWTGNPYDAYLDVMAKYVLNVSLNEILDDPQVRSTLTPVHCILNLTGTINNPTLKFDLELPNADEEMRRQVRSIINTEEAMNRNIASLLAIGHFYTMDRANTNTSGSSELSAVGFSTLSSALGSWISKLNSDISLGVNYRPVSDGVTTTNEVDVAVSTQLFNDRLLFNGNFGYRENVANSPNISNSIVDFDLEYKLSKTGKFRVKGFNRSNNSYFKQSPNTQGVGLIYKEDFDTVGELLRSYWNPIKKIFKSTPKKPEEVEDVKVQDENIH
jgi:hypothetical protein